MAKPFELSKHAVLDAYLAVKANKGSAGIDGQNMEDFEADLKNNLYKLWNRLSSGSYFPPSVKRVEFPKVNGKMRPLSIPTIADRIAQMVIIIDILRSSSHKWRGAFFISCVIIIKLQ